jgi:hypothetical protein
MIHRRGRKKRGRIVVATDGVAELFSKRFVDDEGPGWEHAVGIVRVCFLAFFCYRKGAELGGVGIDTEFEFHQFSIGFRELVDEVAVLVLQIFDLVQQGGVECIP